MKRSTRTTHLRCSGDLPGFFFGFVAYASSEDDVWDDDDCDEDEDEVEEVEDVDIVLVLLRFSTCFEMEFTVIAPRKKPSELSSTSRPVLKWILRPSHNAKPAPT